MAIVTEAERNSVRGAIEAFGGVAKTARHFEVNRVSVYEWIDRGAVPTARAVAIERDSGGKVSRKEMRPRDWAEQWPDLAANSPCYEHQ
ncbi:MAG: helix-turn-helix domain-containing protein [Burkholderiales bacterium]|nr:helix-turn-helix domain-containing protein [Burkholderiales bacterium]